MFGNLVESGSHQRDFRRKSKFFLGTLVFYSALLVAAGVGSIYAYHVQLDDRNELELMTMMRFPPAPAAKAEPERRAEPRPAGGSPKAQAVQVREVAVLTPFDQGRQLAREDTPVLAPKVPYEINPTGNFIPAEIGTRGDGNNNGSTVGASGRGDVPVLEPSEDAPARAPVDPPTPKVEKPQGPVRLPSHVISGKAISKPAPAYPQIARAARVSGTVAVQILIDERGKVISAQATGGHPLLSPAAVQAAYRAHFSPTTLSNQPVKVSGVIYYNFILQ